MTSAVPRPRMATLGGGAPSATAGLSDSRPGTTDPAGTPDAAGGPGIAGTPDTGRISTIVIAGAPRCGKTSVTSALLGEAEGATAARSGTPAFVAFRRGDPPMAYAYVPGRRSPRPLGVEQVRAGDEAALVRAGLGRPPRRVEVLHPADVLRHVSLVDTPGTGGFDEVYTEIVLDALGSRTALLFVTEAGSALQPGQLDFLAQVDQRDIPVIFVLTKIDAVPQWPAVLSADQKLVHDHAPRLATAPWYALSTRYGCDGAPPAAVEEAARGLAGLGIDALRRAIAEPPQEPTPPAASSAVPTRRTPTTPPAASSAVPTRRTPTPPPSAPRVAAGITDERWTELLDSEISTHRTAAGQRLTTDLAAIHARCVRSTDSRAGCARLSHVVDRELHALSVRTTRSVDVAATAIMHRLFAEILAAPPDRVALERIRRATRRAVEEAEGGVPDWNRVLLVISTSGVAVTTGRGAAAALAAVAPRPIEEQLLPPIGVGLSAGCYSAHHRHGDRARRRHWLRQVVDTLETDLGRELAWRFEYLREALAVVALDTVEHGVLLA